MPATLLGGTTTLIGTPPNLLMADLAERLRGEPFTMFEFTPVGAAITVAGLVFIVAIGWRMLPRGREGREVGDGAVRRRALRDGGTAAGQVRVSRQDDPRVRGRKRRQRRRLGIGAWRHAVTTELVVRSAGGRRVAAPSGDANAAGLREGGAHRPRRRRASSAPRPAVGRGVRAARSAAGCRERQSSASSARASTVGHCGVGRDADRVGARQHREDAAAACALRHELARHLAARAADHHAAPRRAAPRRRRAAARGTGRRSSRTSSPSSAACRSQTAS